jgi:hypothetical protein
MHDPSTVAFELKYPWRVHPHPKNDWERGYREAWCTIWHEDPETDGTDDSCGWFIRPRHADKEILEKIVKRFEFDWDTEFGKKDGSNGDFGFDPPNPVGLFFKDGQPRLSVQGVTIQLFWMAAFETFNHNRDKAERYMRKHLFDILMFAENPVDSLRDSITRKYEVRCNEPYTAREREERIRSMAGCVYTYILRDIRPWWKHPRWHVHHWRIQIRPLQSFKRWAFSKCCKCGKGFSWGYAPISNSWSGTGPLWFRSEKDVYHGDCSHPESNCCASVEVAK